MGILGLIRGLRYDLINFFKGDLSLQSSLVYFLLKVKLFKSLITNGMAIKLPGNMKIMIDSEATLNINIPDHYLRKEYLRHPDYIPRDDWIIIDVGAYVGIYTIWASKLVGSNGLVIALEPNTLAFRWLLSNIELNRCTNVKALPYALGDKLTKSTLYIADVNPEASSLIKSHVIENPVGGYPILCSFSACHNPRPSH